MNHRIRCAFQRALAHVRTLLRPPTGRHRAPVDGPVPGLDVSTTADTSRAPHPPVLRSGHQVPYWAGVFVDDQAGPLVRPYLVAHERRQRRNALALALDGVDIGPSVIHGHHVDTPVPERGVSAEALGVAA